MGVSQSPLPLTDGDQWHPPDRASGAMERLQSVETSIAALSESEARQQAFGVVGRLHAGERNSHTTAERAAIELSSRFVLVPRLAKSCKAAHPPGQACMPQRWGFRVFGENVKRKQKNLFFLTCC